MEQLDPQKLGAGMYPFIISAVVPRPIAFISSLSKEVGSSALPGRLPRHGGECRALHAAGQAEPVALQLLWRHVRPAPGAMQQVSAGCWCANACTHTQGA